MRFELGEVVLTDMGERVTIISLDEEDDWNPWHLVRYENGKEDFITEDCLIKL